MTRFLERARRPLPAAVASAWLVLGAIWPAHAPAAESAAVQLERRIKAAFLYKFSGYVDWPAASFARPESPIVIGVAGDDRLANELAQMTADRTTAGHPIRVLRLDRDDSPRGLHILFVTGAESDRVKEWADSLRGSPVLLVTDGPGALEHGSMINFVASEGRIRFEVALGPVLGCGLKLSSGLLTVAKTVLPAPQ
jgi:hypothetical protein